MKINESTDFKNTDLRNTEYMELERPMTRRNKTESVSTSSVHKNDNIDDNTDIDLEQRVSIINISEPKTTPSNNPDPDYKTDPNSNPPLGRTPVPYTVMKENPDTGLRPVNPPPKITPLTHLLDTNILKSIVVSAKDLKTVSQKVNKSMYVYIIMFT
jgi:hypothetical protein